VDAGLANLLIIDMHRVK